MAKKYEFQPDKPYSTWLNKLQLTKLQQKQILKWSLYALLLIVLSVVQDVVMCRMRFYGGTTDLVPCAIFVIGILEGTQQGSVFALVASGLYLLSGSAPGAHVLVLITALTVLLGAYRQTYLHPRLPAMMLTATFAMFAYEMALFGFCLLLGQVDATRILGFLIPAVLCLVIIPILYPFVKAISKIGGDAWKE